LVQNYPLPHGQVWDFKVNVIEVIEYPNGILNRALRENKMWCWNCVLQCLFTISEV
jgi:hypothetical protein